MKNDTATPLTDDIMEGSLLNYLFNETEYSLKYMMVLVRSRDRSEIHQTVSEKDDLGSPLFFQVNTIWMPLFIPSEPTIRGLCIMKKSTGFASGQSYNHANPGSDENIEE